MTSGITVEQVAPAQAGQAVALLDRFFREEGFDTPFKGFAASLEAMLTDSSCWVAVARDDEEIAGVVTVTTALYVEWGRIGEIGDLYVLPGLRGRGVARAMIEAALAWCGARGCSAVSVVVTPEGEQRYGLSTFYGRLKFDPSGRTIMTRRL